MTRRHSTRTFNGTPTATQFTATFSTISSLGTRKARSFRRSRRLGATSTTPQSSSTSGRVSPSMTAVHSLDDVAFSIRRIVNPSFNSPQLSQFDQIVSADAEGLGKVKVKTKTPYPALLAQLVKLSIVPRAIVEKAGDQKFNLEPIGSGPYKLQAWQKGVQTTLIANENYWRGKPQFKTVTFRVVPDVSTRVADLRSARADLVRQLGP